MNIDTAISIIEVIIVIQVILFIAMIITYIRGYFIDKEVEKAAENVVKILKEMGPRGKENKKNDQNGKCIY